MPRQAAVLCYPGAADLLDAAARHIIAAATTLPLLEHCVVLLPDPLFATELRRRLLQAAQSYGCGALLGPHISTPEQWLADQAPLAKPVPGRARRELLLVEAISGHRDIFGAQDPWALAASLLTLFDELTLHRVPVDTDVAAFRARLQQAYGLAGNPPEPFDREARIVQRLWQAWHEQLAAFDLLDPATAQLQQLAGLQERPAGRFVYFVGIDAPSGAMSDWIATVLAAGQGQLLLHRPLQPAADGSARWRALLAGAVPGGGENGAAGAVLDAVFGATHAPLQSRTAACRAASREPPLGGSLHSFAAASAEQEARAIELQVRRWLLAGYPSVAVVTEDRRLGRRVRALLERAGILLNDPGGWALSTTRAAAALERWLQTVEEDFAHEPLLDTLKSPFTLPDTTREQHEHCVYRFETDIVRREQVGSGLQRYRHHIRARLAHYETRWSKTTATQLELLLDQLEAAAAPLQPCLSGTHAPAALLSALRESLQRLGIWQAFSADPAGLRIQEEWRLLHDAARDSQLQLDWNSFRAWLGSALERHDFRPALNAGPVWLLNVEQARLGRFAGIVIGACDAEHLPPVPAHAAFFNDRVRTALGLPAWPQRHQRQLEHFRVLLQGATQVLLTWHREQDGEPRTPAAWLARLEVFHRLAWQHDLQDRSLAALLDQPGTRVTGHHPLAVPEQTSRPDVVLPASALPQEIPVSAHGTLIDCPYRFFAGSALQLRAREEVRRELEKAEFGSLVHRALLIFHQGADGYPAPLAQPLDAQRRGAAIAQLEQVSRRVFTQELEDSFENRAWLRRWLLLAEPYVDWLIEHQAHWRFASGERDGTCRLTGERTLTGRIDRIDNGTDGALIIDYKTGAAPAQDTVEAGEAVQLPSYALLAAGLSTAVQYVVLDSQKRTVSAGARLQGDALTALTAAVRARLDTVLAEIAAGQPLPAWGDAETCRYCEMDGLCRKAAWPEP